MKIIRFMLISFVLLVFISSVVAQGTIQSQCGDIIESEFTATFQEHEYKLDLAPGDVLNLSVDTVGDVLKANIVLLAPDGAFLGAGGRFYSSMPSYFLPISDPTFTSPVLSSRGNYTIIAWNGRVYYDGDRANFESGGVGIYTLYIGCTLRDGTVIAPGDVPSTAPAGGTSGDATTVITAPFTGIGFPGLPPVDFANGITLPFSFDAPNSGGINPGFDAVFGFTLDANPGDKLDLTFTRLSGNMNLGLAVLSADNKIVYQASLVNTERMNALFTLPTGGTYTIGVFKIDLIPVDAPENTAFQLTGVLNP
jgi:hypothetical protein